MPVLLLEGLRDETKGEIRIRRKQKSKGNFESLMSYAELLGEMEKLISNLAAHYNYSARSTLSCAEIQYFPANDERRVGRAENLIAVVKGRSQDPTGVRQLGSGGLGWSGWSGGGGGVLRRQGFFLVFDYSQRAPHGRFIIAMHL
jgi:hypothetical protein